MYKVYDKPEAIRQIQIYLRVAGNPDIFIFPSGIYDENTRLAVLDFQSTWEITPSGEVDRITFDKLYEEYATINKRNELIQRLDSFIRFPIIPGKSSDGLMHINRTIARVLDYYGYTHRLRDSNFYSDETAEAVRILRGIYSLDTKNIIDEEFYLRLINDHDSIERFNNNFG